MYILECADGSYYTGSTWELEKRLWEHQNKLGANYTAKRLPVKLVYCEECDRVEDAFRREKQIQGWSRTKKQALIVGDTNQLHRLAECKNESHCSNANAVSNEQPPSRSLSGVEGNGTKPPDVLQAESKPAEASPNAPATTTLGSTPLTERPPSRSLSGVDASAALSNRPRSLSGVEGSEREDLDKTP
jgi:putative endonuclease